MSQLDVFRLDGRVALVPGRRAARSARRWRRALAGAGARVAVVDVTDERAEAAAAALREAGAEVLALGADVTTEAECERIVAATVERFGRLDIIVNCVGGGAGKVLFDAEAYPRDAWDWIYELNVRSTLVATQAAVKAMIAGGRGGRVLNISSVRASLGHQRRLLGLRRGEGRHQLAHPAVGDRVGQARHHRQRDRPDLRRHAAGGDARSTTRRSRPASSAGSRSGRVGGTSDLTGAALFFCSDASSFVTGQILGIDGGLTATQ